MVAILGAGESGLSAALLAKQKGLMPFVSDLRSISLKSKEILDKHKIPFEEGGHSYDVLSKADMVIKSPGIPGDVGVCRQLRDAGLQIISELEFAFHFTCADVIAITGTNGKTTTTNLVHHVLEAAGLKVIKGGNLGRSFSRLLLEEKVPDYYVLEVSSFQLDDIVRFKPKIAVVLNITPDHLDRYNHELSSYAASKMRITMNQNANDVLIIYGNDPCIKEQIKKYTLNTKVLEVEDENLSSVKFDLSNPYLRGRHNAINASFAIEIARALEIPDETIDRAFVTFRNDDHRMEVVAVINGIEWINDSKATNVEAVYFALEAVEKPVIWIAGGIDKGNDYRVLMNLVREKVKVIICLGSDNEKLLAAFSREVKIIEEAKNMEQATAIARDYAKKGDAILLSPACASFDLFKNYKDRGDQFKNAVWQQLS